MRQIRAILTLLAVATLTAATIASVPDGSRRYPAQSRTGGAVSSGQAPAPMKYAPNELLVKFERGTDKAARESANGWAGGAQTVRAFRAVPGLDLVRLPAGMSVKEALGLYRQFPGVVYAEPNYRVQATGLPNDPQFGSLWGMHNTGQAGGTADADIDAPEAWNLTTGSPDVVVAVIDSGIDYTHEDLAANMFRNTADCNQNGVDDDGNGYIDDCYGIDTANNDSDPMDDLDHGTHTAGTIGAAGNNSVGVAGVSHRVKLMPCKFLDASGSGYLSGAIACLDYVKTMKDRGVNIVATNNSWGGGGFSQALYDAIGVQRQRGILFIAAAGNNATDNDLTPFYPASYDLPNVIAVAATTRTDSLASFSNHGRHTVHLAAPGQDILSTTRGNTYKFFSGTSMAAPHVSGVAALLEAQDPSRDWRAIKNLILTSGDATAGAADTVTGRRLNAYKALTCSDSPVLSRLQPIGSAIPAAVGSRVSLVMLNANCGQPAGDVSVTIEPFGGSVTLVDDGTGSDQVAGDAIYSGEWTPPAAGTFTVQFPNGDVVSLITAWPQYEPSSSPFAYRTIAGTSLNLTDDSSADLPTPFPIRFGPLMFSRLFVSSNGTISATGPFFPYVNNPIPVSNIPTLIAPFWDDLLPLPGNQNVFWAVTGSSPNRELVVEWRDVELYGCPGATVKFQVVLFEGRSDILFNYADTQFGGSCAFADQGGSATVGVQVTSGVGRLLSYNSPGVASGSSLLWTLNQPMLNVTPDAQDFGAAQVGTSADRSFTISNHGGGTLTGTVTAPAPFEIVSGASFSLSADASQPVTVRFMPTSVGAIGASMQVTSNAGSALPTLFGIGLAPPAPPIVSGVVPWSGAQGKTVAVDIVGANLDGATGVAVSGTGVISRIRPGGTPSNLPVDIVIDANAPVGTRTLAVTTARGVSSPFSGFEVRATVAPGGNPVMNGKIAFQSSRDGNAEIYVMDADGRNPVNLTRNAASDTDPTWCSDGTKLAFASTRTGRAQLHVMNDDGTGLRQLTTSAADDSQPAWSPDCSQVTFTRGFGPRASDVYVINADGSGERALTHNVAGQFPAYSAPAWSPNGTTVALMASQSDTNTEIYVVNADGTGLHAITSNGVNSRAPQWSPNGQQIAFDRGPAGSADIWVMNADGTAQRQLTITGGINETPAWSPDGSQILFNGWRTGTSQVYVMNADGSNQRRLTTTASPVRESNADWQTTGQIVFASTRQKFSGIHVMNADGSRQRSLSHTYDSSYNPVWSPDRRRIAFVSSASGDAEIWVMNADGSGLVHVSAVATSTENSPTWSPDGACLAFSSWRTWDTEIWKACGPDWFSSVTQLTSSPGEDSQPAWSPDGSRIVFFSRRAGGQGLYLMNPDGSDVVRINTTTPMKDPRPSWSPDGRWIAYAALTNGSNQDIYRIHVSGLHEQRLTNYAETDGSPTWSPDGNAIAFRSSHTGNDDIFVIRVDGTTPIDDPHPTPLTSSPASDYDANWGSYATPPGTFGKIGPPDATTGLFIPMGVGLRWQASSDATGYEYCYDTLNNGLCDTAWLDSGKQTVNGAYPVAPGTTYFWQVRARRAGTTTEADGGQWWSFRTSDDATPPTVISVTPPDGATGVGTTSVVTATFSEPIDDFTFNYPSAFTLRDPAGVVVARYPGYDPNTHIATLIPSTPLAESTTYTATITGVTDWAGNVIAPVVWRFTTGDRTPPTVLSVTPPNNATGVSTATAVTITFSEAMDSTTLTAGNVVLRNGAGVTVNPSMTYIAATHVLTLTPLSALAPGATYTVTVGTGVRDLAGNPLPAPLTWCFTTASAPVTIGVPTIGTMEDWGDRNYLTGSKVTTTAAGRIASMSVYVGDVDSLPARRQYQVGIYTDNGGRPGTLVAVSPTGTLAGYSWNTVSISASLLANTRYWLIFNTNGRTADVNNMLYASAAAGRGAYSALPVVFGTWPATFPAATMTNYAFSLYATTAP